MGAAGPVLATPVRPRSRGVLPAASIMRRSYHNPQPFSLTVHREESWRLFIRTQVAGVPAGVKRRPGCSALMGTWHLSRWLLLLLLAPSPVGRFKYASCGDRAQPMAERCDRGPHWLGANLSVSPCVGRGWVRIPLFTCKRRLTRSGAPQLQPAVKRSHVAVSDPVRRGGVTPQW